MGAPSGEARGGDPALEDDLLAQPAAGPAAIRGGVLRVAGYAGGVLVSLASAALLFRHLGVAESGRYVTVISLVAIVSGLSDAGLTATGVRDLSVLRGEARRRLARDLTGLRIVLTIAGVVLAIGFGAAAGYDEVLIAGTAVAGLGLLFQSVQVAYSMSLTSRLRFGWLTAVELVRQLLTVALIVVLVVVGAELLAFLAVPIPAGILILAITAWLVRSDVPLRPAFDLVRWRALLREILPYSLAVAAGVVYFRVAIIVVSLVSDAEQTGYFGASFRIVDVLVVVPGLLVGAAFPIFARAASEDHARFRYALGHVVDASVIIGAWVALSLALGAPLAIEVVAGADFEPAADVLRIQSAAVGAAFVGAAWGYALISLRLHRELLAINVGALIGNGALVAVLASVADAEGAAVATVVAESAVALVSPLLIARAHPHLRLSARVVPRVALAAAAGAALALVPGLPVVVLVLAASAVYFGALHLLRAIPEELIVELRAIVRGPVARGAA